LENASQPLSLKNGSVNPLTALKLKWSQMSGEMATAKNSRNVCAATAAYNNPHELTRLLSSLENQNDSLNGLVVIDNSDDRYSLANQRIFNFYAKKYALARYYRTEKNIGSAGGFRRGMKIAHENDFDWVWLLDQDGAVSPTCLTELLKHTAKGDLLCPNIVGIPPRRISEPFVYVNNFLGGRCQASRCAPNCQIDTFGTHGVLISKKAIDTIGYYDDSLFFVGYEDFDYGYRAVQEGLVIFFAAGAEALHPSSLPTGKKLNILSEQLKRKIRPARIDYISYHPDEKPCSRTETKSILPFSQAYMESKYLSPWQFGIAIAYSGCNAVYHKILGEKKVCLKLTLRMYVKCLVQCQKKDWPYNHIEQLCREVLK
jgi:GT2 family glycosyltransferase